MIEPFSVLALLAVVYFLRRRRSDPTCPRLHLLNDSFLDLSGGDMEVAHFDSTTHKGTALLNLIANKDRRNGAGLC